MCNYKHLYFMIMKIFCLVAVRKAAGVRTNTHCIYITKRIRKQYFNLILNPSPLIFLPPSPPPSLPSLYPSLSPPSLTPSLPVEPPYFLEWPQSSRVVVGSPLLLRCLAASTMDTPTIQWTFNGQQLVLRPGGRKEVGVAGIIKINSYHQRVLLIACFRITICGVHVCNY